MTTLGGQSFAQAFNQLYWPVSAVKNQSESQQLTFFNTLPALPFFEAALGGAN
jgi:hypothetical protein